MLTSLGRLVAALVGSLARLPPLVVGESFGPLPPFCCPRVYVGATFARCPGVGSNRTQPEPRKYTSGQACMSCEL